jgi:hypothetical protein
MKRRLDLDQLFLDSYGHVIEMALKKILRPSTTRTVLSAICRYCPSRSDRRTTRSTFCEVCCHFASKGNARSEQIAEQLADQYTAKEHPKASTAPAFDLNILLTKTFKTIPND